MIFIQTFVAAALGIALNRERPGPRQASKYVSVALAIFHERLLLRDHEMRTSIKILLGVVVVFVLLLLFIPAFGGHPHPRPVNASTNSTANTTAAFANYTNYTRYGAHGVSLQGIIRRVINEIRSSV